MTTTRNNKKTRTVFSTLFFFLLTTLTVAANGRAQHVFQPAPAASSVVAAISSSNAVRGGGGGKVVVNPKQPKQQQRPKQAAAIIPASSTTASSCISKQQQVDVLQRSAVTAISCITTWAMTKQYSFSGSDIKLNPIQAAGVQGLLACALCAILPKHVFGVPFCAASFCGAVGGMSAHTAGSSLGDASLLGLLCGIVYYIFERPDKKLQLGKGGRLGTIAFLANVVYFAIRKPGNSNNSPSAVAWLEDAWNLLQASTVVTVVLATIVLNMSRSSLAAAQKQQQQQVASSKQGIVVQELLATASKGVILAALLARLLETTSSGGTAVADAVKTTLVPLAKSTLAMLAAIFIVQKSKPFIILPVALIGLTGATFVAKSAAPLLLGAFLGMTGLPQFTTPLSPSKFLQASILACLLMQLGLFVGFGGRLGFLAFIGVNFAL